MQSHTTNRSWGKWAVGSAISVVLSFGVVAAQETAPEGPLSDQEQRSRLLADRHRHLRETERALQENDYPQVRRHLQSTLQLERRLFGAEDARVLATQERLADVLVWQGDLEQAAAVRGAIQEVVIRQHGEASWQAANAERDADILAATSRLSKTAQRGLIRAAEKFRLAGRQLAAGDAAQALLTTREYQTELRLHDPDGSATEWSRLQGDFVKVRCLLELDRFQAASAAIPQVARFAATLYPAIRFPRGHPDLVYAKLLKSAHQTSLGKLPSATQSAEQAAAMADQLADPKLRGTCLRTLATAYLRMGKVARAGELLADAQDVLDRQFPVAEYPDGTFELAMTLDTQGDLCIAKAEYDQALLHFRGAQEMRQNLYPRDAFPNGHRRLAANLSRIGGILERQGRFEDAKSYHQQALDMYRALYAPAEHPTGHRNIARQLRKVATFYLERGDLDRALRLGKEAVQMTEAVLDELAPVRSHPDYVRVHNAFGRILKHRGDYQEAQTHYRRALEVSQRAFPVTVFPDGHFERFECHNNLGTLAFHLGQMDEAVEQLTLAVKMARQLPVAVEPFRTALATQNLATVLYSQQHFERSIELFQASLEEWRRIFPEQQYPQGHPQLANTLMNLGVAFSVSDDPRAAATCFEQAADMLHAIFPKEKYPQGHPLLFRCLTNLASEFSRSGRSAHAVRVLERALNLGSDLYPPREFPDGHPDLASALNSLSHALHLLGDYRRSLDYCGESLKMSRQLDPTSTGVATALHNMGVRTLPTGQLQTACDYLRESLELRRKLHAPTDPRIASSLQVLARAEIEIGEFDSARTNLTEATGIYRHHAEGQNSATGRIGIAECKRTLGWLELRRGDDVRAMQNFERAIREAEGAYSQGVLSAPNPRMIAASADLGMIYHRAGQPHLAMSNAQRTAKMVEKIASHQLPWVSEARALNYLRTQPRIRDRLLSLSSVSQTPAAEIYDHLWWERGAIHRTASNLRRRLANISDQETKRDYQDWLDRRRQIARLTLLRSQPDPERASRQRDQIQLLLEQKDNLEQRLLDVSTKFPAANNAGSVPALRSALPAGVAFVDLRLYNHIEYFDDERGRRRKQQTARYAAFVLQRDEPIQLVSLGDAAPIDASVREWRKTLMPDAPASDASPAKDLRTAVWLPLEKNLRADTQTIFVSPDGTLTGIPWGAIPGQTSNEVLLERLSFVVVASGGMLLEDLQSHQKKSKVPEGPLLLVGSVDYEHPSEETDRQTSSLLRAPPTAEVGYAWPALPATRDEIEQIASLASEPTLVLSGVTASPANVLRHLPKARRAHLATHGFFADEEFQSVFQVARELFDGEADPWPERNRAAGRNPLILSGIVLSGANLPRKYSELGLPIGDGGYLTAEAIAGLQLENLDLVTLSACDTGLGELAGGEGVFGLQRAFHVAGARTVVASLWKVDDLATQELMRYFYENLYTHNMSKVEALRQAQLRIYRRGVNPGGARGLIRKPNDPTRPTSRGSVHQWGAWTLSGDWR